MVVNKVLHILTEFQFEAAGAIAEANILQRAVGGISDAASNALATMNNLGKSFASSFGVGGGLVGILGAAVSASENFNKQALSFSNIISANMDNMTGDVSTFNDRLLVSGKILRDIAKDADKFSLNEADLIAQTKQIGAVLAPKGATGENFGVARDLSRNFLKSAPTLGVDPGDAQGQLIRAIEGSASLGDTLFRRLLTETAAFSGLKAKGGSASKAFNQQSFESRLKMMQEAMSQFSSDADVLAGNANLLSSQFVRIKNLFFGVNSILKPLGDIVVPRLKEAFKSFGDFLNKQGRRLSEELAKFLDPLISNPERLYITIRQMADLRGDLEKTGKVAAGIGIASIANQLVQFATGMSLVSIAMRAIAGSAIIGSIGTVVAGFASVGFALSNLAPILAAIGTVFTFLASATGIVAFFTTVFQIISRARAIADVADIKNAISQSANLATILNSVGRHVSRLLAPFEILIDALARFISPLFEMGTWISFLYSAIGPVITGLDYLATAFQDIFIGMNAMTAGMFQVAYELKEIFSDIGNVMVLRFKDAYERIKTLNFTGDTQFTKQLGFSQEDLGARVKGTFDRIKEAMQEGGDRAVDALFAAQTNRLVDDKNVAQSVTNIGKVEIRQEFKENMEPDRIAAGFSKILQELAQNPTQSRGNSLAGTALSAGRLSQ